jgi:hypothetical protein
MSSQANAMQTTGGGRAEEEEEVLGDKQMDQQADRRAREQQMDTWKYYDAPMSSPRSSLSSGSSGS